MISIEGAENKLKKRKRKKNEETLDKEFLLFLDN